MRSGDPPDLPRFAELAAEYEILRELGRGGTAVVYLARERELDREVAIKVIRATYVDDEEAAARLLREAHTIAGLQHPNIVMLYGTRRLRDDSLALVMQYIPGRSLRDELQARGALPFPEITRILTHVGRALDYAHRRRIVHRDVKPENIYLDDSSDVVRLSDFGIARPWDGYSGLTLPGTTIGTPAYMSPEQIAGEPMDGRADLYSLGLVGWEMLTGTPPWAGESLFDVIYKQKHEELPSLADLRPDAPSALRRAVEGALLKHAEERWRDAGEFLAALAGELTEPRPVPAIPGVLGTAEPTPPPARPTPPAGTATTDPSPFRAPSAPPPPFAPLAPPPRRSRRRVRRTGRSLAVGLLSLVALAGAAYTFSVRRAEDRLAEAPGLRAGVPLPVPPAEEVPDPGEREPGPGEAAAAQVIQGDAQAGAVGEALEDWLVVRVEDADGAPVQGAQVRFRVAAGEGTLEPETVATNEFGMAGASLLPRAAGRQVVEAHVEGLAGPVATFHATARSRPVRISSPSPTDLRARNGGSAPIVVRVEDDNGSPVPGVPVRFSVRSGEGRVAPVAPVTDGDGTLRAEWLFGSAETQEVEAILPDLPEERVVFRATAAAPPPPLPVRRGLAAGGTHTCSLGEDGTAACWGANDAGQLGDEPAGSRGPVHVAAPEPLSALSAGVAHTCGLGVSGAAFCWGANAAGQLGDGTRQRHAAPRKVALDEPLRAVAAGMSHSCGLDASGRLFCWGQNQHGQLGDGSRTDRRMPVPAGSGRTFHGVALGWAHTCAVAADGAAHCWGRNASGELGDGGSADRTTPVPVAGGHRFTGLAAGSAHTCGVRGDGTLLCWGDNSDGQLGTGDTRSRTTPVAVASTERFSTVVAGGVHTCALTIAGAARCWGRNTYGQLGDGTTEDRAAPVEVAGGHQFAVLGASGAHTCGTAIAGASYCWGYNVEGQLGNGTRDNQTTPVEVAQPR